MYNGVTVRDSLGALYTQLYSLLLVWTYHCWAPLSPSTKKNSIYLVEASWKWKHKTCKAVSTGPATEKVLLFFSSFCYAKLGIPESGRSCRFSFPGLSFSHLLVLAVYQCMSLVENIWMICKQSLNSSKLISSPSLEGDDGEKEKEIGD